MTCLTIQSAAKQPLRTTTWIGFVQMLIAFLWAASARKEMLELVLWSIKPLELATVFTPGIPCLLWSHEQTQYLFDSHKLFLNK